MREPLALPVRFAMALGLIALILPMAPAFAAPNPPWPPAQCSARAAIVLDTSSSITAAGAEQQVRDAAAGLAEEMRGQTTVELGLFTFWQEAETLLPYTPMTDAGADAFIAASNVAFSRGTNWQAGFREVFNYDGTTGAHWNTVDAASPTLPDVVVFVTDGKPTRWVQETSPGVFEAVSTTDAEALIGGELGADRFRSAGIKVAVIGVGDLEVSGLQAISGPTEFDDYWLTDFAGLAGTIVSVGNQFCDPPRSDIGIDKAGSGAARPGTEYQYTVTVTNFGPDTTASPTSVVDDLPAELELISATGDGWDCSGSSESQMACVLPPGLESGAAAALTVLVQVSSEATGEIVNTVTASNPDDRNPDNDRDTETTPVDDTPPVADLSIDKDDAGFTAIPGEPLVYTLTVTNAGPDTARDVEVSDALPSGLTLLAIESPVGTCAEAEGTAVCTIDELPPGSFTVTLTTLVSGFQVSTITNVAMVESAAITDPDPTNNVDQETTPVVEVLAATGVDTDVILPLALVILLAGALIVRRSPRITPISGRIPPLVSGIARLKWRKWED